MEKKKNLWIYFVSGIIRYQQEKNISTSVMTVAGCHSIIKYKFQRNKYNSPKGIEEMK